MDTADEILRGWYAGELGGEAIFDLLAAQGEPAAVVKWRRLGDVERHTGGWLAAILTRRGQTLDRPPEIDARAAARHAAVGERSWADKMQWLRAIAEPALHRMQQDAARLPDSLAPIGKLVVDHERALLEFADLELTGRSDASLRVLDDHLQANPLPLR